MRLIDGHALMESLQKATSNAIKPDFAKGLLEAQRLTINAPTIDAVEVVRCKDCQYGHMTYNGECKYCDVWEGDKLYLDGRFYCGFGKRREKSEVEE